MADAELRFRCPCCGITEDIDVRFLTLFAYPTCDGATNPYTMNDRGVRTSPHARVEMEPVED